MLGRSDEPVTRGVLAARAARYLSVGTLLHGLVIERLGTFEQCAERVPWRATHTKDSWVYRVRSRDGEGVIVAGGVAVDESDAGPSDPVDSS